MTFASRETTHRQILEGATEVICGGRNCNRKIKVTKEHRKFAEMSSRLGIAVVLCRRCGNKIRSPQ